MPVQTQIGEDGKLTLTISDLSQGLDSLSEPTDSSGKTTPDCQNVTTNAGFVAGMDGSTLHLAGFVTPDGNAPLFLARYVPSSGTAAYIMGCQNGQVYRSTNGGATWTSLRRGLTTDPNRWSSHAQIGDYLIIGNGSDANYKYDGNMLLPIGAKHIANFESGEGWAGSGSDDTTNVRQGLQGRKLTSTGAAVSTTLTPSTPWNLVTGLLAARNYATSDFIDFQLYLDTAANLDTANTFIRFGDVADAAYYQSPATGWGTLANGWNRVHILKSTFAVTGAPNWNNIAKTTITVDATGATTVNATFDDLYAIYVVPLPAGQIIVAWKNMILSHAGSNQYFSPVGAPDQFDTVDTSVNVIDENDGTVIKGVHPFADYLLVAKDNSVHAVSVRFGTTVYPDYDFSVQRVTTEHGCSSHRSMVEKAGRVLMWWRDSIYGFAGIGTQKSSEIISPTLADVEETRLDKIVAGRLQAKNQVYWFWTPNGGSQNTNGITLNTTQQAWLPIVGQTAAVAETVYEGDVEYLLTGGYSGRVLRQETGTTFDGAAITRHFSTDWLSAGPPHPVVSWRRMRIHYDNQTSGNLIVEYRTARHPREFDTASYTTAVTIAMNGTSEYGWIFLGARAPWLQIRFRTVGAQFSLFWPLVIEGHVLWRRF